MSTLHIAKSERMHVEALAELEAAREQVQQNADRLADTRARMDAITQRRVAGTVTAAEAAEYAALQGDEALLQKMHSAAEKLKAVAVDKLHGAYVYYTDAKAEHDREQAKERYKALVEQTQQIEAMFIKALGAVGRAGQAIGISTMGGSYPKSTAIRQVFDLNQIPPEV